MGARRLEKMRLFTGGMMVYLCVYSTPNRDQRSLEFVRPHGNKGDAILLLKIRPNNNNNAGTSKFGGQCFAGDNLNAEEEEKS